MDPPSASSISLSEDPSILPRYFPYNLTLETHLSDPPSAPSDFLSRDPSIFPVPYPTLIIQKSLQKSQMSLPVVTASLSCAPEAALLQLELLNILLQDSAYAYPTDITAFN